MDEVSKSAEEKIPTIDMQDLAMVVQILNIAIKRGVFEPNELSTVGQTYSKIEGFLKHQAELQAAQQALKDAAQQNEKGE